MNGERFSKTALAAWAFRRKAFYESTWRFTNQNGWAQVAGKSEETNRAYGEYAGTLALIDSFDLWAYRPKGVIKRASPNRKRIPSYARVNGLDYADADRVAEWNYQAELTGERTGEEQ